MFHVLTCNGYRTLASTPYKTDALTLAKEFQKTDSHAVIIMRDSVIVGDAIGGWAPRNSEQVTDAATLTGMYDRY